MSQATATVSATPSVLLSAAYVECSGVEEEGVVEGEESTFSSQLLALLGSASALVQAEREGGRGGDQRGKGDMREAGEQRGCTPHHRHLLALRRFLPLLLTASSMVALVLFLLLLCLSYLPPPSLQQLLSPTPPSPSSLLSSSSPVAAPLSSIPSSSALPGVCLQEWSGRWGNHVYQLMFILSVASCHQLFPYIPAWDNGALGLSSTFFAVCPQVQAGEASSGVIRVRVPQEKQWGPWFQEHPLLNLSRGQEVTPSEAAANPVAVRERGVAVYGGYFQFHHSGYRPYRPLFRQHIRLEERRERALTEMWHRLLFATPDDVLLVAVHIRHGDYSADASCFYCRIPIQYYLTWLDQLRSNHTAALTSPVPSSSQPTSALQRALQVQQREEREAQQSSLFHRSVPVVGQEGRAILPPPPPCLSLAGVSTSSSIPICLLLLSDDVDGAKASFLQANESVLTSAEVVRHFLPAGWDVSDIVGWDVLDWWLLTRASMLAISHSSFSYTAALFSTRGDEGSFWRPRPGMSSLAPFDPWDSQYEDSAFQGAAPAAI